mmetsp:Transcript_36947/g.61252  ORF Transcript_36947/g.61252 Transcript_36947/m.61252 type:complete len:121 (-) Transcript_36947:195-557(-)
MRKVPPITLQHYRGPNHILVSRRSSARSLRSRVRKLFGSGRWHDVYLHGLGAALPLAVMVAAELVHEGGGLLVASTTTSTEMLIDRSEHADLSDEQELHDGVRIRYNSAVHIHVQKLGLS